MASGQDGELSDLRTGCRGGAEHRSCTTQKGTIRQVMHPHSIAEAHRAAEDGYGDRAFVDIKYEFAEQIR